MSPEASPNPRRERIYTKFGTVVWVADIVVSRYKLLAMLVGFKFCPFPLTSSVAINMRLSYRAGRDTDFNELFLFVVFSARCNIYISRLCYDVSVCLSV